MATALVLWACAWRECSLPQGSLGRTEFHAGPLLGRISPGPPRRPIEQDTTEDQTVR